MGILILQMEGERLSLQAACEAACHCYKQQRNWKMFLTAHL